MDPCTRMLADAAAGTLDENVADHVERCAPCAEQLAREKLSDELREIGRRVATNGIEPPRPSGPPTGMLAWLPARTTPVRIALGALGGAGLVGALVGVHPRPDLAEPTVGSMVGVLAFVGLLLVGLDLAMRPLHRPALGEARRRLVLAAAMIIPVAHALVPWHGDDGRDSSAAICFAVGIGIGTAFAGLLLTLARSPTTGDGATGLAVAAAGVATLALSLFCGATGVSHLVLGHAGVAVAFTAGLAAVRAVPKRVR
jgi:hypothetical protein